MKTIHYFIASPRKYPIISHDGPFNSIPKKTKEKKRNKKIQKKQNTSEWPHKKVRIPQHQIPHPRGVPHLADMKRSNSQRLEVWTISYPDTNLLSFVSENSPSIRHHTSWFARTSEGMIDSSATLHTGLKLVRRRLTVSSKIVSVEWLLGNPCP